MSKSCKSTPHREKNNQHIIESLLFSFALLTSTSRPASRFQSCSIMSRNRLRNSVTLEFNVSSITIYALKWSVTPTFLSRNTFYLQLSQSILSKNEQKTVWEGKKFHDFCPRDIKILPLCGCSARGIVVVKCKLFL